MEDGHVARSQWAARSPRYDGEDLSPTTTRELRGFYAFSLAAEVFAVCGVGEEPHPAIGSPDNFSLHFWSGSFLPVTLEQLARERGVLWSDRTTPCLAKTAAEHGTTVVARLLSRATATDNNQCIVNVLGAEITTSSFVMYTSSLAVFVQALALVSFSSIADHGEYSRWI
jgi:UMF1 family MFS transporter